MKPRVNKIEPKKDFLTDSKAADRHTEIVMSPEFRHATLIAFAEFASKLDGKNPVSAPKLEGAKEVLNILLELGNPNVPDNVIQMKELEPN